MKRIVQSALCAVVALGMGQVALAQVAQESAKIAAGLAKAAGVESSQAAKLGAELGLAGEALKSSTAWSAVLAKNPALVQKLSAVNFTGTNLDTSIASATKGVSLVKVASNSRAVYDSKKAADQCDLDLPEKMDEKAQVAGGTARQLMKDGILKQAACGQLAKLSNPATTNLIRVADCASRKGAANLSGQELAQVEQGCLIEAFQASGAQLDPAVAAQNIEKLQKGECEFLKR